jgi:glutamate dehydrogenase (NAD(P)+)
MLVGVADSRGTLYNLQGLDVEALIELKKTGKSVADYPAGKKLDRDAVIDIA